MFTDKYDITDEHLLFNLQIFNKQLEKNVFRLKKNSNIAISSRQMNF